MIPQSKRAAEYFIPGYGCVSFYKDLFAKRILHKSPNDMGLVPFFNAYQIITTGLTIYGGVELYHSIEKAIDTLV